MGKKGFLTDGFVQKFVRKDFGRGIWICKSFFWYFLHGYTRTLNRPQSHVLVSEIVAVAGALRSRRLHTLLPEKPRLLWYGTMVLVNSDNTDYQNLVVGVVVGWVES